MHGSRERGTRTAALAAGLLASAVAAGGPPEELLVTGTRLPAATALFPGATTVLDRAGIDARNDALAVDLLRDVPGLHVNQPGAGGVAQVFIRGAEPNFTVFLLDGIEVNDLNNTRGGSFDLASLNLADLERVEIVRGPQSSIYGSDGLAGVVNFISRDAGATPGAAVELEAGGEGFRRGSLRADGPLGATAGVAVQASHRDDGEAVPGSTNEVDTVSARLRWQPAAAVLARAQVRHARSARTTYPEQSGGPELAVLPDLESGEADDLTVGGDLAWTLNDRVALEAIASVYDRSDQYDSPGIAPFDVIPPNGARNDLERRYGALRATVSAGTRLEGTVGVDHQRESGTSGGYVEFEPGNPLPTSFDLDRRVLGLFAEGRFRPADPWVLQASLRRDDPDEADAETTARLGAVYSLPDGATRVRVNWGTGFKLPGFFALGSPLVGNPDLRPETSTSLELGLSRVLAGGAGQVDLALFDNDYEDLIDLDPDTFRNVNRDRVTTRGAELAGTVALSSAVSLRGHVTFTDIDVKGADRELQQRPEWRGGAALRWQPSGTWLADLDWLYTGDVLDSSLPTGQLTLPAWNRVDLSVTWTPVPGLAVTFAVDNLLDAHYEEAIGFPAAGLRPRLGFRFGFGA